MAKILRTESGVAVYPWLAKGKPDTRFDADGFYKVDLDLPNNVSTQELIDNLQEIQDTCADEIRSKMPAVKAKKLKLADMPFEESEDGKTVRFKFKMKAKVKTKKGKTFTQHPAVFDAQGNPMLNKVIDSEGNEVLETVDIRGGTVMRVAFEPIPYENPLLGVGVSFRLKAVQISKLVQGGEQTASAYGFDEVEGHTHTTETKEKEYSEEVEEETADFEEGDF